MTSSLPRRLCVYSFMEWKGFNYSVHKLTPSNQCMEKCDIMKIEKHYHGEQECMKD